MIVGIDLGTTNSLVAVWRDGETVLIPNSLGKYLTPSVVAEDAGGRIVVGEAARDLLVTRPGSATAFFKRYMGTDRLIPVGKKTSRPDELSAMVLSALKADAEAFLGETVDEAVITVPAYFNDAQRKATKAAGQMAGLKVDRLLTEPTAAALAYGFATDDEESTILVVDLGGGTLDVSLLHAFEGIMEVKATAGDIWLGGEDFTDVIVTSFITETGIGGLTESTAGRATLRRQAELAKRALSELESTDLSINHDGKSITWTLTRDAFDMMCEPLLAKVRRPLERALRDARLAPDDITRIILAGGATRMPMFRRLIARLFRQLPVQSINPDEVVGRGAAVRAGLVAGSAGLEEHVLTDVSPFTLGVSHGQEAAGGFRTHGLFLPIIERNTIIPASRVKGLATMDDNQTVLTVAIYQGESRFVRDNILLGEIKCQVPAGPAGKESIEVRFSYDSSGLLDVDVTVESTGVRKNLVIEGNPGVLTKAEVAERLAKLSQLKVHPRDDAANIAVLTRADRVFQETLADVRMTVGEALVSFNLAIERQDPEEIAREREELTGLLNRVDHNSLG
jgi:molecular chaperone HscC